MFYCPPTLHRLGNRTVEFIGNTALFLVLLISANLCKFLINFLLPPAPSDGALYHLNVKFRALYIQKMLLGNVWSIPAILQKRSKIVMGKISEVFARLHMWDYCFSGQKHVIQEITFVRKGKPRSHWQQKPRSSKTQDFTSSRKFMKVFWYC